MKNLLKPARIIFYVLMLLTFFIVGLYYAGFIEAGKNQGLAGGAIVLGWGVLFGGIAFVLSFFIAYRVTIKNLKIFNWVLLMFLISMLGYKYYQFQQKKALQENENTLYQNKNNTPTKTSKPISANINLEFKKNKSRRDPQNHTRKLNHIGFFKPNLFENPTLYFYKSINLEKGIDEHQPIDSLVVTKDELADFTLLHGPPWLFPEHLKLDYGIVFFKVLGVGKDVIKLESNKATKQISYVNRYKGDFIPIEEFILSVNTLEYQDSIKKEAYIKPFDYSSKLNVEFQYIRPLLVEEDWTYGILLNNNFEEQGKGWIQWRKDGKLLVRYSFLS